MCRSSVNQLKRSTHEESARGWQNFQPAERNINSMGISQTSTSFKSSSSSGDNLQSTPSTVTYKNYDKSHNVVISSDQGNFEIFLGNL